MGSFPKETEDNYSPSWKFYKSVNKKDTGKRSWGTGGRVLSSFQ